MASFNKEEKNRKSRTGLFDLFLMQSWKPKQSKIVLNRRMYSVGIQKTSTQS